MKEIRRLLFVVIVAVFFIGLFVLCDKYAAQIANQYSNLINPSLAGKSTEAAAVTIDDVDIEREVIDMVEADYSVDMTLTATGEIMCQSQQLTQAYDEETGKFSFSDGLKYLKDVLSGSDFTVAAFDTTMAGSGNGYADDVGGYCASDGMYNSPEQLAQDLADAGYTLVSSATRHSLDSGTDGVSTTIDNLSDASLEHVGTAKTSSDSKDYILKSNYVTIAITGYTSNTGSQTLSASDSYAVNTLAASEGSTDSETDTSAETETSSETETSTDETSSQESSSVSISADGKLADMCSHVTELQDENDFVIVMIDFGSSDSEDIETEQKTLAEDLAKSGADLILGTGSRSMKPMDVLTVTDSDGMQRQCTVFYGLGSVYSSDYYSDYENLDTDISAVIKFNLRNSISGKVELVSMEVIPIYLNWYNGLVQPVPVCEAKDSDTYADVLDEDDMTRIDDAYSGCIDKLLSETNLKASYNKDSYSYTVDLAN